MDDSRRPGPRRPLAERLADKVDTSGGPDACWPFTGRISVNRGTGRGYGQIRAEPTVIGKSGRLIKAHRAALILKTGEDRPDEDACHSCDNSVCCNPSHLSWGTHRENMKDYIIKYGRIAVSKRPLPPRPNLPFDPPPDPTDADVIAAGVDAAMAVFDE